jgi:hypothetical protein
MSEVEAVICDKCREVITDDEVLSTDDYESLCQSCYDNFIECACCSEVYENAYVSTCDGDPICRDCYNGGDVGHCTSCDAHIVLSHGDYYYDDHSGEYCCSSAADSTYLDWSCESCGCDMTFEEAGTDHAEQYLCYDCYHNPTSSIQRLADSWIDKADVHTQRWYKNLDDGAQFFLAEFYRSRDEEFKCSGKMIKKGLLGAGTDEGWWDGEIEVQSPAFADMAKVIADMCYSDLFFVKHKKYGLYHPFRHLFHQCLSYRDREGGDTVYYNRVGRDEDPQIAFEEVCRDYHRWELYSVRHNKLATMLAENKTEDGANLRKTTSNIMNRSYADRFALLSQRNNSLERSYQQYLTNAVNQKYNIRIGFNSDVMMDLADFNSLVGSCQDSANRMSYAFGFADMLVNPHLLALIYENNEIIGRSVIRFWKHNWDDSEEVVKIAPSRLYLSRITNAKADVYVALFKQVNEWAKTVYGIDNYEIIAYSDSRHDSPVYSFIRSHISGKEATQRLNTQVWNTFWHSKPQDDCADYTYYKDEMQRAVYFGQRDSDDYAVKETLPNYGYRTLELD